MQNRAYSVLTVKAVDDDARVISGVATTPSVDREGDIIDPLGVKFTNPMPFLWQHDSRKPIGTCDFGTPTKDGIPFTASIASIVDPGTLKDRLDEAWQSIKLGLVRAVSIGFRPLEYAFMEAGGIRYTEVECWELSAVTIPANADAVISAVKSVDRSLRAAAGVPEPEIPVRADGGASAKSVRVVRLSTPARDRAPPFVIRDIKRIA